MSRLDYSKWDHIEISDDEDDTHPNIDTPSLFRWRHQARVERMEESKKEKEALEREQRQIQQKQQEMKKKLQEAETKKAEEELSKLTLEMSELQKQEEEFHKKEEELKKKEKLTPWNVDTLCHDGKDKTIVNVKKPQPKEELSEEDRLKKLEQHVKENKKKIEKFGMFRRYEDSEQFLSDNPDLVCEETANHLVLWCINLEVEEKHDLMHHVAHQTIVMQFILELAKSLEVDPRGCVKAFFSRIKLAEKQYMDAFTDELDSFKERVRGRAKARIEEALREYEEEEKQKRIAASPGGLDPQEVFETLPKSMQDCFEVQDIAMLQTVISEMDPKEASYHMKRCVDSGLWVPNAADLETPAEGETAQGETSKCDEEEIYEDAKDA